MAIVFPDNPSDGDLYDEAGRLFRFTDPPGVWESVGSVDVANIALGSIDDLDDVNTTNPAPNNGDALVYNGSLQEWVPGNPSFAESDPVFQASPAASITNSQITNWDEAYSWGDHAQAGYLTDQNIDGGAAATVYTIPQVIDGGGA